jgi:hypothetical protein
VSLPDREEVVTVAMHLYDWTFHLVFVIAVLTIGYLIWHLIPRKEY